MAGVAGAARRGYGDDGIYFDHSGDCRDSALHKTCSGRWRGIDHQHRWDTARRLLHDGTVNPEDRLAGLLVLLYAQGATAISQMTTSQIQAGDASVRLRLGRVPIHLPEPVAVLARTVLANRKGHAAIGARQPSPWLFPGGQPGRPISTPR